LKYCLQQTLLCDTYALQSQILWTHLDQCRVAALMRNASEWLTERIETEDNERCLASLRLIHSV